MYIIIDFYHRRKGAAAKAAHRVQAEPAVLGCFAGLDVQAAADALGNAAGPLDMAGRALAHMYGIAAPGLEAEGAVKRGD